MLAVDIFRERVTLQAESGDARVVALERLASELEATAAGGPPRV